MGGKGQRRREKNYRAAHGGSSRLPPPPDPSSLDVLPFKLRKLLSFSGDYKKQSNGVKKNTDGGFEKASLPGEMHNPAAKVTETRENGLMSRKRRLEHSGQAVQQISNDKKKKKRKRNVVNDLRFEASEALGLSGSKRKERKKQRIEARKQKRRSAKIEDDVDFRGREDIKFGEVVKAPPKLIAVPKVLKKAPDASQERLRLQAIDAYRERKGWTSRLGVPLPVQLTTPASVSKPDAETNTHLSSE